MSKIIIKKKKAANPFPHIPDPYGYGQRAVDFLRSLKHPASSLPDLGFQLDPWNEEIVRKIYSPRGPNGERVITDVTILIGRGNRKTTLAAALAILHTMGPEASPGGEVLFVAQDERGSRRAFEEMEKMLATQGKLWRRGQDGNKKLSDPTMAVFQGHLDRIRFPNHSYAEFLTSQPNAAQGRSPLLAICDEVHCWPREEVWDVIQTGLAKRPNSLRITLTTSGVGQDTIGYKVIENARRVLRGEVHEPWHLPFLFELAPEDDWTDESLWIKANPGLPFGYPNLQALRKDCEVAKRDPMRRSRFRAWHLNQWQEKTTTPFVEMSLYDKGSAPIDEAALEGQPCWIGVDLGATDDLSAVVCAFRDGDEGYIVLPHVYMPDANLDKRTFQSGFDYLAAVSEGLITATQGNVTDYRVIEAGIRDLCERYQVQEIAFDPHYAGNIMQNLLEDGYPCVSFRQGWATMGPAIKEWQRALMSEKFQHGGNPVLRWCVSNIALQDDGKGNLSFHKGKSREKIDAATACAMAISRAATGEDHKSVYDTDARPNGFLILS